MKKCEWPICPEEATHGTYCFNHNRIYGTKTDKAAPATLSIPDLTEKAQKEFNRFIRERDMAFGCLTCGSSGAEAGHFIPVGENSALRFEEDNCHLQCHVCNTVKRGNREIFRAVMIQKYGEARVIELETFPKFHKFSRTQLENIIDHYSLLKYSPK